MGFFNKVKDYFCPTTEEPDYYIATPDPQQDTQQEPSQEDQFEYYDAYLVEVIQEDLEERALIKMLDDCKVAVKYYQIQDVKKVEFFQYCVELCEDKLERIGSQEDN